MIKLLNNTALDSRSNSYPAARQLASHADVLRLVTRGGTRDKSKNVCVGGDEAIGISNLSKNIANKSL